MSKTKKSKKLDLSIIKVERIRYRTTPNDRCAEIIEFGTLKGRERIELPASVVSDKSALYKRLRDACAIFPRDTKWQDHLDGVATRNPGKEKVFEAKAGWSPDRKYFVRLNGAIGKTPYPILGVNLDSFGLKGRQATAGTWKTWRNTVGRYAGFSSTLVMAASSAFAAPLLAVTGERSFALCMFARTHSGKTIATTVAGSIIGLGTRDDMLDWDITDASLGQRLPEYNDAIFPIDDLQRLRDRDKYPRVRSLAYALAGGSGTSRHSSYNRTQNLSDERWRSIVLTSNEFSIQEMARRFKMERQGGELARLIDVPVLDPSATHIFDRATDFGSDLEAWKTQTFKKIATACAHHHGAVFNEYIKSLLKLGGRLQGIVENEIAVFRAGVSRRSDDDIVRAIASKFGLLYAGGKLAIRADLVPWRETSLLDAISKCYRRAISLMPNDEVCLEDGLDRLAKKLASLPVIGPDAPFDRTACNQIDGYRTKTWGERVPYLIKKKAFNAIFDGPYQRGLVEEKLIDDGHLTTKENDATAPKDQFFWCDGKRRHALEIHWIDNSRPKTIAF
jgi:hypothetical protein